MERDHVIKSLKTIAAAAKEIGISPPGMRWIRFNSISKSVGSGQRRMSNGFEKAFVKVGRRVFVDMEAFYRCVAEQNGRIPMEGGASLSRHTARKEVK